MPSRHKFPGLPTELERCALQVVLLLESRGYRIRVGHSQVGFPNIPTIVGTRAPIVLVVETVDAVNLSKVADWVSYCRAAPTDTRMAVAIPREAALDPTTFDVLQDLGVGLYSVSASTIRE